MPIEKKEISFDYRELQESLERQQYGEEEKTLPRNFESHSIIDVQVPRTNAEMEHIRRKIGDNFSETQLSKGVVVIEHSRPQGLIPRQPRTTFLLLPAEFVLQALIGYCKDFDIRIPASKPKRLIAGDLHISIQYEYSQSSLELED